MSAAGRPRCAGVLGAGGGVATRCRCLGNELLQLTQLAPAAENRRRKNGSPEEVTAAKHDHMLIYIFETVFSRKK